MKILQVGKFYYPSVGGIETTVQNISEGLVDQGVEVSVLCFSERVSKIQKAHVNGVEIIQIPMLLKILSQPLSWQFPNWLIKSSHKYDLVHFHSPNPLAESAAQLLPLNIPQIVTYHSDVIRQKLLLPLYQPILRRFLKQVKKIIIPSQYHLEFSYPLRPFKEKCQIIPFGIHSDDTKDNAEFSPEVRKLRRDYGHFLLFVGRLVGYKGLTYLIEAMGDLRKKNSNLKLVIVGDGPLKRSIQEQIQRLNLQDQVILKGQVESSNHLKAYYQACDFLVLPSISRAEAFGMVLLEAMSYSKPVITTCIPSGMMDINLDQVTGIQVKPCNTLDLSAAILRLSTDLELRRRMGTAAKNHVSTQFSNARMIRDYLSIYQELQQANSS